MKTWMILTMLAGLVMLTMVPISEGATIIVDDDDTTQQWSNYTTIQDALNNTDAWDTVRVYNGTYNETPRIWDTGITIIGNSTADTRVNGDGLDSVFYTSYGSTSISHMWINNSGSGNSGINYWAMNGHVHNVTITNCYYGVRMNRYGTTVENSDIQATSACVRSTDDDIIVRYNDLTGTGATGVSFTNSADSLVYGNWIHDLRYGIGIGNTDSMRTEVYNNTVEDFSDWGIFLSDGASLNEVHNNTLTSGDYGIAIFQDATNNNTVYWNSISTMDHDGLYGGGSNNTLHNNTAKNCTRYGIYTGSDWNTYIYNEIFYNDNYGIYLYYCENNTVHHNNFADNGASTSQGYDNTGYNSWDDGSEGNYWDDWGGTGTYVIAGNAGAEDEHPLDDRSANSAPEKVPELGILLVISFVAIVFAAIRRR